MKHGGEGGIRTLGALLELGALAKLCFRPLSHLTMVEWSNYNDSRVMVKLQSQDLLLTQTQFF